MPTNFYLLFVTALIPIIIGFVYYHEKVAGTAWMNVNGFTKESIAGGNMAVILGLSYLLGLVLSFSISGLVIHQGGVMSMMYPDVFVSGSEVQLEFNALMEKYGDAQRSFKHGIIHGTEATLFIVLPLIAINALFERRGWKYILIHLVYWWICFILIGGILCEFLKFSPLS